MGLPMNIENTVKAAKKQKKPQASPQPKSGVWAHFEHSLQS